MRKETVIVLLAVLASFARAQIRLTTYVTGLSQPVAMIQDPTMSNVQYVVQKTGLVKVIQNGVVLPTPFINLTSLVSTQSEEGAVGLAISPASGQGNYIYIDYTNTVGNIQIVRYTRSTSNPLVLDPATALPIITQAHPNFPNHNGGTIKFGPDGYLYAGWGDGGSEYDPNQNGQNPNTLLSKMIRIDPTSDDFPNDPNKYYHIPADNPYIDGFPISAAPEAWDMGLRNPWKWSFDSPSLGGTGALIIGDVGQDAWEEIDFEQPNTGGYNYGWRLREGFQSSGLGGTQAYAPLTDPIYNYAHYGQSGNAIIGGYVYRGSNLGSFWTGRYFFADESSGDMWSLHLDQTGIGAVSDVQLHTAELTSAGGVSSIDIDSAGELYFVSFTRGTIYKVVSSAVAPSAINLVFGSIAAGGISDLSQSDDSRLVISKGYPPVLTESPVAAQLSATAPAQTASAIRFFFEAQATSPNLTQIVELWDYAANAWVQVDSRAASVNTDSRFVVVASNPNRFIQSGTKSMLAQIRYFQNAPTPFPFWQAKIDQAVWGFTP